MVIENVHSQAETKLLRLAWTKGKVPFLWAGQQERKWKMIVTLSRARQTNRLRWFTKWPHLSLLKLDKTEEAHHVCMSKNVHDGPSAFKTSLRKICLWFVPQECASWLICCWIIQISRKQTPETSQFCTGSSSIDFRGSVCIFRCQHVSVWFDHVAFRQTGTV